MTKPKWIVVNFSGGKDSTALLLRMIELGEHIDEIVCCDTYKEFPGMYRHIAKVKEVVTPLDIKFTELRNDKSFDYFMFDHRPKPRPGNEPKEGYYWPCTRSRWCTSKLKTDVVNRYFRELNKTYDVIYCLGIAADEQYRLERDSNKQSNKRFPLVEWGWSEKDCLEYCYSKGYDWEGLYKLFSRVSCWCCPLQPLAELRKLNEHFPELWEELKDMDNRTWRKFKWDYSVQELETRFDLEREFEAQGKSIRSREFFDELKKRIA